MTDPEFYFRLINCPCDGCPAYEEIGHCGTWSENCLIYDLLIQLDDFLDEMGWDKDEFLDCIMFKELEEPEWLEFQELVEIDISNMEDTPDMYYYGNL